MRTTCDFLDAVKAKYKVPSDYALAPMLGITRSTVSRYRTGKDSLGDETALRVAALLNIDPAVVFAAVHAERASAPAEKAVWQAMFERLDAPRLAA